MPDASTLEGLALRVEQSAGADRTLDGLIEAARDPMRQVLLYNEPGPFPQKAVFGPLKDLVLTGVDLADYIGAPRYTASLDAAMSLVPEGCGWEIDDQSRVGSVFGESYRRRPRAHVSGSDWRTAATPALALTAACLRGKAALERGHE